MKRYLCVLSVLLSAVIVLTACNFYTNVTNSVQNSAQSTEKVEAMMAAMADGDLSAAVALMHPDVAPNSEAAITQMQEFLGGRDVKALKLQSVSVNNSTGTAGKVRQETAVFQAVLADEVAIYISVAYRTDNAGEGFISFQIVLGVV